MLLKSDAVEMRCTDWSRDGRFIIYERSDPKTSYDLWVLPLTGGQKPFPFLQTEFNESQGRFSPTGAHVAYTSNESGRNEVYVRPFPAASGKVQVSTDGGDQPRFRRDGKELFYLAPDRRLMTVAVKGGESFEAGLPQALFETRIRDVTIRRYHYDVTGDGERFLVNTAVEQKASAPITLVLNWTADLKR